MPSPSFAVRIDPSAPAEAALAATTSAGTPGVEAFGRTPLSFEPNQGQTDSQVQFLSRGNGYTLSLTPREAVLNLRKTPADIGATHEARPATVLRMQLVGANEGAEVAAREELSGKVNYFLGNDPAEWHTDIPTYARVEYQGVYEGIDLAYYGNEQQQLEYDFVVAPGARPSAITLAITGADRLEINPQGELVLHTPGGEVRQHRPIIYQVVDGIRKEVAGGFVLKGGEQVGFRLDAFDPGRTLIIDPVLSFSTYLGGSGADAGLAVAVDSARNVYVTGETTSLDFPVTAGTFQGTSGGGLSDVFVAKFSPSGQRLYATYLGGDSIFGERGQGIAVDAAGNAYVTGRVGRPEVMGFPANDFQSFFGGGDFDAFVTKLNPAGSGLVYSTYLGGSNLAGSGNDAAFGIAVDSAGNAYVAGGSESIVDFPITPSAFQPNPTANGTDAFFSKLDPTGNVLLYSTWIGGSLRNERANGVVVDSAGNAYVVGQTTSFDFPTRNAVQPNFGGASDGFLAKFNPAASEDASLLFSTYLGGSLIDRANGVALGPAGHIYVAGQTESEDFPTVNAVQPIYGGFSDAFVTKLSPAGTSRVYSTYVGGGDDDRATAIAVSLGDHATITGGTSSTNFPTRNAIQPTSGGDRDAFVTKLAPAGTSLVYSTYLGGADTENPVAGVGGSSGGTETGSVAVDSAGNVYVTGRTASANFPKVNPFQSSRSGINDMFLARIIDDATVPLFVTVFTPTPTGFVASFNRPIDASVLNLYDLQASGPGPADVNVTGATTGAVAGSLVVDATRTRITFVRTGGLLPPDTYTVTLRSAANAFKDDGGGLLDGDGNGTAGDNFTAAFPVTAAPAVTVSVPDFSRGPGQPVNVPATAQRLPLQLSNGAGVTSVRLTLVYNPALLTVTGVTPLPPGMATLDTSTPGRAVLTFTSTPALPAGPVDFVTLTAQVPTTATYGESHVFDITEVTINNGAIAARDDDGVHVVAYFGDATGNRAYSSADASRVLRVAVGLDSGLAPYLRISPVILADINRNDRLDSTDATRILQEAVGIDRPEIPPIL